MSVAGGDGFYADALGDVFRASSVSANAGGGGGLRLQDPGMRAIAEEESAHVCQSCRSGMSCQQGRSQFDSSSGGGGGIHEAQQDSTHSITQLGNLVAAGQLDLGLEGQLGSHGI